MGFVLLRVIISSCSVVVGVERGWLVWGLPEE